MYFFQAKTLPGEPVSLDGDDAENAAKRSRISAALADAVRQVYSCVDRIL